MSALEFDPVAHRYKLDGKSAPGVTTILGGGIPKLALMSWYAEQAALYVEANPDRVEELRGAPDVTLRSGKVESALVHEVKRAPDRARDQAAERGTALHKAAEALVAGEDVTIDRDVEVVEHYARFLDAWGITPVWTERQVASRDPRYCGTFDLLFTSPKVLGGAPVLADVKTTRSVHEETSLQLAAYSCAQIMLTPGGECVPMPEVTANVVLHLTPDGVVPHTVSEGPAEIAQAYQWFLAAHATYSAATARRKRLGRTWTETPTAFYQALKEGTAA